MEQRRTTVKIVVGLFVFVGILLLAASIFLLGQRGRYFSTQHSLRAFFTKVGGLHDLSRYHALDA
jgi:ABC-type transporter Mla subunit MlaD